jgi:hypothetical protein
METQRQSGTNPVRALDEDVPLRELQSSKCTAQESPADTGLRGKKAVILFYNLQFSDEVLRITQFFHYP